MMSKTPFPIPQPLIDTYEHLKDIENYMQFCLNTPKSWIGFKKGELKLN